MPRLSEDAYGPFGLTQRDLQLVHLVCEGLENEEIGERLGIARATVRSSLNVIMRKTGVRNRTQLAVLAIRHGLVRLEDLP
jgi:DNA-binding NarL/FixJ family response regulator